MHLKTLKLKDFRCFSDKNVSFKQGINVIYGLNAVGKTSLLEAINYLVLTKSFKEYDDSVLYKEGTKSFSINGSVFSCGDEFKLKILRNHSGKVVFKNDYKFLEDYGFCFTVDPHNSNRPCYKNRYGEIIYWVHYKLSSHFFSFPNF